LASTGEDEDMLQAVLPLVGNFRRIAKKRAHNSTGCQRDKQAHNSNRILDLDVGLYIILYISLKQTSRRRTIDLSITIWILLLISLIIILAGSRWALTAITLSFVTVWRLRKPTLTTILMSMRAARGKKTSLQLVRIMSLLLTHGGI
jgi:hypothetical protein